MIIQNLHKNGFRLRLKGEKKRVIIFLFTFLLLPFALLSQDSIPATVSVSEQKNEKFQLSFFKALSEKAINNHQKAIENLETCNEIIPNNKAVLFELSKNYLTLNKVFEALEYATKALEKDPKNIWLLEHLVAVYKKDHNYREAIKIQQKIIENYPKKKQQLVYLHLQNRDTKSAKKVLKELESSGMLSSRLRRIKSSLTKPKAKPTKEITPTEVSNSSDLKSQFEKEKSFNTLKKLLLKYEQENNIDLQKYSKQGIDLFPAQPFVYLMNGKALNNQKASKKALIVLQNGIDFVIDNNEMEANFYTEMAIAYAALGKTKEADKYRKKAKK